MSKPILWKSLKTGNEFPCDEYWNHGHDGIYRGLNDLPLEEYPFELICNKEPVSDSELSSWFFSEENKENNFIPDEFDLRFYKATANFMIGPVNSYLNANKLTAKDFPIRPAILRELIMLIEFTDLITFSTAANKLLPEMIKTPDEHPYDLMVELNLMQNNDESEIEAIVDSVIAKFPEKVKEYIGGKKNVANMFVGEVMRTKKGLAPKTVSAVIEKKLQNISKGLG